MVDYIHFHPASLSEEIVENQVAQSHVATHSTADEIPWLTDHHVQHAQQSKGCHCAAVMQRNYGAILSHKREGFTCVCVCVCVCY